MLFPLQVSTSHACTSTLPAQRKGLPESSKRYQRRKAVCSVFPAPEAWALWSLCLGQASFLNLSWNAFFLGRMIWNWDWFGLSAMPGSLMSNSTLLCIFMYPSVFIYWLHFLSSPHCESKLKIFPTQCHVPKKNLVNSQADNVHERKQAKFQVWPSLQASQTFSLKRQIVNIWGFASQYLAIT